MLAQVLRVVRRDRPMSGGIQGRKTYFIITKTSWLEIFCSAKFVAEAAAGENRPSRSWCATPRPFDGGGRARTSGATPRSVTRLF